MWSDLILQLRVLSGFKTNLVLLEQPERRRVDSGGDRMLSGLPNSSSLGENTRRWSHVPRLILHTQTASRLLRNFLSEQGGFIFRLSQTVALVRLSAAVCAPSP